VRNLIIFINDRTIETTTKGYKQQPIISFHTWGKLNMPLNGYMKNTMLSSEAATIWREDNERTYK
jgi:hypothetical protein